MEKKNVRIHEALKCGIKTQEAFEELLNELAVERLEKVKEYGEGRYEETDFDFNLIMCYSDIYRKFIRLKTLTKNGAKSLVKLRETYLELASYGIMAVQIIDMEEKKND